MLFRSDKTESRLLDFITTTEIFVSMPFQSPIATLLKKTAVCQQRSTVPIHQHLLSALLLALKHDPTMQVNAFPIPEPIKATIRTLSILVLVDDLIRLSFHHSVPYVQPVHLRLESLKVRNRLLGPVRL